MERCGAKKATILGAGSFEIQNENTNRVKWVVRRKAAFGAGWRRMGKKNFTRVRVKFKTRREREQDAIRKSLISNIPFLNGTVQLHLVAMSIFVYI